MFPLDTVKVIAQLRNLIILLSLQTHMQASYSRLGFLNAFRALKADEGLLRLWKGSHVMALGCIPSHASYFLTYEKLKLVFGVDN